MPYGSRLSLPMLRARLPRAKHIMGMYTIHACVNLSIIPIPEDNDTCCLLFLRDPKRKFVVFPKKGIVIAVSNDTK